MEFIGKMQFNSLMFEQRLLRELTVKVLYPHRLHSLARSTLLLDIVCSTEKHHIKTKLFLYDDPI
jgi:hypothetical protein